MSAPAALLYDPDALTIDCGCIEARVGHSEFFFWRDELCESCIGMTKNGLAELVPPDLFREKRVAHASDGGSGFTIPVVEAGFPIPRGPA